MCICCPGSVVVVFGKASSAQDSTSARPEPGVARFATVVLDEDPFLLHE